MRRAACFFLTLICLAGCQNRKLVDNNPVLGPPPPRVSLDDSQSTDAPVGHAGILQTSATSDSGNTLIDSLDETIIARISGEPVFAADVLRPFRPFIETQRQMLEELPPTARANALRRMDAEVTQLVQRALPDYVDREVVLQSIDRSLKPEQISGIQEQIDKLFYERVDQITAAAGLSSRAELEQLLTRPNDPLFPKIMAAWREGMGTAPSTSLSESLEAFGKMAMAAEYLRAKAKEPEDVDRAALLAYYREHAADYDVPLEVRWQQIVVSHAAHGGPEKARDVMQQVLMRLRKGEEFAEVARDLSDGPSASAGGERDWIAQGSLADTEIENELFQLRVGDISSLFERPDRYEIVRLAERRGGRRTPFSEVQAEIRKQLLQDAQQKARQETLEKMRQEADIVILFDPSATATTTAAGSNDSVTPLLQ